MRHGALTVPFWSPAEIQNAIRVVVDHLAERRVLAYPTETVYGFGTAVDHESVETLVRMKQRPPSKPFLLLIAGSEMLDRLGLVLTPSAANLAARFWPGPLTLVLPGGDHRVPSRLRGPEGGVAVRWTPHEGLQALLKAYGEPITSTSANRPGVPPAVCSIRDCFSMVRYGASRRAHGARWWSTRAVQAVYRGRLHRPTCAGDPARCVVGG